MTPADKPSNEAQRLQALFDYEILDTPAEEAFDQLTALASAICGTPIALVSLVDETRQWFKSHHGLDASETPRELAFCAHAINQDAIFEIQDSRKDMRFHDNPLVTDDPNVVFYAGAPLTTTQGFKLGTLCVIDNKPSHLDEQQRFQLEIIAQQVVTQLELRKSNRTKEELFNKLMSLTKKIEQRNLELDAFSTRAAHDIKSPISQILHLADFSLEDMKEGNYSEAACNCKRIIHCCDSLRDLIQDIFALSRADINSGQTTTINLQKLVSESIDTIDKSKRPDLSIQCNIASSKPFVSEAIRLRQIIYNLVSNGIKYANPEREEKWVAINISDIDIGLRIEIKDNGVGIPADKHALVFTMFERFNPRLAEGTGLGLAIVKKHVDSLAGTITFSSDESGSTFCIDVPDASRSSEKGAEVKLQRPK